MNTNLINIVKGENISSLVEWNLSFRPLVAYLKRRIKTEHTVKREFYRFLLEKLESDKALERDVDINGLYKHRSTLELIFIILTPLMANEKELFWALSTPVPNQLFFSTDLLYDFILENAPENKHDDNQQLAREKEQLTFIYSTILSRFYKYNTLFSDDLIFASKRKETDLSQYYKVNVDTQFIEITYKNGTLPTLNLQQFHNLSQDGNSLKTLQNILPLSDFKFDGFTVVSLTDVTLQHSLDVIKNTLVNHACANNAFDEVVQALKTLANNANLNFSLLPLFTVNGKPVFDANEKGTSALITAYQHFNFNENVIYQSLANYQQKPRPLFLTAIDKAQLSEMPVMRLVKETGVKFYAILPVFYNAQMVGVLEIFSAAEITITDEELNAIYAALPLLGQLFQLRIDEFNTELTSVLKDKFTALQPAVQWKFNQQAWAYIKDSKRNSSAIPTITFKDLYPLFGAIDIRNSTLENNLAQKKDLQVQLLKLQQTLKELRTAVNLDLLDKYIFECTNWLESIEKNFSPSEQDALNNFLNIEVLPTLKQIAPSHLQSNNVVDEYMAFIDPTNGHAFANRRAIATALMQINTNVNNYLERAVAELQKSYPCYFSKFRTDGVEYDIYIGQEIAPEIHFDEVYLKNIRLWQLQSMVEIARLTKHLSKQMEKPLYTTQLIFIHSNPITITFRNDERRFDVEGTYNVRYEVIKKRIDKITIAGTKERLTKVGSVSLVYYNDVDVKEYITYITFLQNQGYLQDQLSYFDLEEAQGVTGLKAIRVDVKY